MLTASFREGAFARPDAPPPSTVCPAIKLGLRHPLQASFRGARGAAR
jgi:hypothetical protein